MSDSDQTDATTRRVVETLAATRALVDVVTRQVETLSANIANNREDMSAIKRAVESLERDMQDFERVLLRGNGRDAIVAQLASMQNRLGTLEQRITALHESVRRIRKSDADLSRAVVVTVIAASASIAAAVLPALL